MYNRYNDISKFITQIDKLQISDESCYISKKDDYDIVIDLESFVDEFDDLKPFIIFLSQHICELDNTVQKFNNSKRAKEKMFALPSSLGLLRFDYSKSMENEPYKTEKDFPFTLEVIYLEKPNFVILDYWHTQINSQLSVVFEYKNDKFYLRSFGMFDCIPDNWDKND